MVKELKRNRSEVKDIQEESKYGGEYKIISSDIQREGSEITTEGVS